MKKSSLTKLVFLSAIATLSLASCESYDYMDESEIANAETKLEYTNNFVARYGAIDPNHTWGFGYTNPEVSVKSTRSGEMPNNMWGEVKVNRNQWVDSRTDGYLNMQVPGWPNDDNYYYSVNSGGTFVGGGRDYNDAIKDSDTKDYASYQPAGDVTDYEIQYVSHFFRTHKNIESNVELHLSDFFTQNISGDYDREETTTGVSCDGGARIETIWGQGCSYGMDQLKFKTMESTENTDTWTHLNNYNRNNTNDMTNDATASVADLSAYGGNNPTSNSPYRNNYTNNREIKYVASSGTEDFAYNCSFSTSEGFGNTYYKHYVLVKLEWKEIMQDGQLHDRVGYYLAFDFEASKEVNGETKTHGPDGYYSNWIIKITPAHNIPSTTPEGYPKRIMVEDLGNTCDFDFNDVVFDVVYSVNTEDASYYDAVITLQATGATLPITVGNNDSRYEVHKLLGSNTLTQINVGRGYPNHDVAIYRVKKAITSSDYSTGNYNVDNIGIWVKGQPIMRAKGETHNHGNLSSYKEDANSAPQKFCVPSSVRWLQEKVQIEDGYSYFDDWVRECAKYDGVWFKKFDNSKLYGSGNTESVAEIVPNEVNDDPNNPASNKWDIVPAKNVPASMMAGEVFETGVSVTGVDALQGLTYSVEDESVLRIESGYAYFKVTALKAGNTTLKITFPADETHAETTKEYHIEVVAPNKTDVTAMLSGEILDLSSINFDNMSYAELHIETSDNLQINICNNDYTDGLWGLQTPATSTGFLDFIKKYGKIIKVSGNVTKIELLYK